MPMAFYIYTKPRGPTVRTSHKGTSSVRSNSLRLIKYVINNTSFVATVANHLVGSHEQGRQQTILEKRSPIVFMGVLRGPFRESTGKYPMKVTRIGLKIDSCAIPSHHGWTYDSIQYRTCDTILCGVCAQTQPFSVWFYCPDEDFIQPKRWHILVYRFAVIKRNLSKKLKVW